MSDFDQILQVVRIVEANTAGLVCKPSMPGISDLISTASQRHRENYVCIHLLQRKGNLAKFSLFSHKHLPRKSDFALVVYMV